jgi:hypothetical protein
LPATALISLDFNTLVFAAVQNGGTEPLRMTTLRRAKNGAWIARKALPLEIRAAYRKAYGQGYEVKASWPASLPPAEAKSQFAAWLAETEARIKRIRRTAGLTQDVSDRQLRALSADIYRELVANHESNPGDAEGWLQSAWAMEPGDPDIKELEPAFGLADQLATRAGHSLTPQARYRLAQFAALDEHAAYCLLARRAEGDYGEDRHAKTLPPPSDAAPIVSPLELFDGYAKDRQPAAATIARWRPVLAALGRQFPDAAAIT